MIFQKQNCPGDSQKKGISCFSRTLFSNINKGWCQLSEHDHTYHCVQFWTHLIFVIVFTKYFPRMHVLCSKYIHMSNQTPWTMYNNQIWAPKNLTEPKNQRFGLFLFLLTRPRGVRPRGPPIHIQGHSSPDRWAAILCSLDVQIGDSLYEQITTVHQRDLAVISFLFVCQQIGIQSQITLQKSRLGKNTIFS